MTLYSFSHFFQSWILPPGVNILLAACGVMMWFYSRTIGNLIIIFSIITLWLLSTPFIAYNIIDLLQNKFPMLNPINIKNAYKNSVIVVLGGGDTFRVEYENKHTVSDTTEHRLEYAAYLHEKTHLPIIVSGGKTSSATESEAELMAKVLQDKYKILPKLKEDKSMTTADESKYLAPIFKKNNINHIYLVTNAWHMPRSVFIFKCSNVNITPAPMGYYTYGPGYALISFMPNLDALHASTLALHEFIGLLWYRTYYRAQCNPILL